MRVSAKLFVPLLVLVSAAAGGLSAGRAGAQPGQPASLGAAVGAASDTAAADSAAADSAGARPGLPGAPGRARVEVLVDSLRAAGYDSTTAVTEALRRMTAQTSAPARGFHPVYSTSYSVNRNQSTWDQRFDFESKLRLVSFHNSTSMRVEEYTGSNPRKSRRGSLDTGFDVAVPVPGLTVGGSLTVTRDGARDNFSNSNIVNNSGALRSTYVVHPLPHVTLNMVGGGSATRSTDLREQFTTGGKVDSTRVTGARGNYSLDGSFNPGRGFSLQATYTGRREGQNSKTSTRASTGPIGGGQAAARQDNRNRNLTDLFTLNTTLDRGALLRIQTNGSTGTQQRQFYFAPRGAQETAKELSRQVSSRVTSKPFASVDLNSNLYYSTLDRTFALDTLRTSFTRSRGVNLETTATLGKTRWRGTFNLDRTRNDYRNTTSGDIETNFLETSLDRPLTPRISANLAANVGVVRNLFDDGEQDRDDTRNKLEGKLDYRPGGKMRTSFLLRREERRAVSIASASSGNNTREENYGFGANLDYTFSERATLSQNYWIAVLYTFYDYDDSRNTLTKTITVTTSLSSVLTPRVTFTGRHDFQRQESGGFRVERGGRIFARGSDRVTQDLRAGISYALASWLKATLSNHVVSNVDLLRAGVARPSLLYELSQGIDVNRNLVGDTRLTATASRTLSSRQDGFWVVNTSLNKPF